ncbi:MAG: 3-isopropylmalate dehydratase small subunit [Spirochaetaceae bacterium]|nr:3-isopropylmalate dehydratase small subunit [Spirochaetaceae bacterium]
MKNNTGIPHAAKTVQGRTHVYGDNIDTDVIIPARYLNTSDPRELAAHCLEDLDPEFINKIQPGDILVAGENFGCGSSREHAPIAIKAAGIACVIAASFARIFYRNAINIGLPILECPDAARALHSGDMVALDFETGEIRLIATAAEGGTTLPSNCIWKAQPFPLFIRDIIEAGGLVEATRRRLAQKRRSGV